MTLSVSYRATQEQIHKAYKVAALRVHPDKNPGVDTTAEFQKVNCAYDELKDPKNRKAYDIELRAAVRALQNQNQEFGIGVKITGFSYQGFDTTGSGFKKATPATASRYSAHYQQWKAMEERARFVAEERLREAQEAQMERARKREIRKVDEARLAEEQRKREKYWGTFIDEHIQQMRDVMDKTSHKILQRRLAEAQRMGKEQLERRAAHDPIFWGKIKAEKDKADRAKLEKNKMQGEIKIDLADVKRKIRERENSELLGANKSQAKRKADSLKGELSIRERENWKLPGAKKGQAKRKADPVKEEPSIADTRQKRRRVA